MRGGGKNLKTWAVYECRSIRVVGAPGSFRRSWVAFEVDATGRPVGGGNLEPYRSSRLLGVFVAWSKSDAILIARTREHERERAAEQGGGGDGEDEGKGGAA